MLFIVIHNKYHPQYSLFNSFNYFKASCVCCFILSYTVPRQNLWYYVILWYHSALVQDLNCMASTSLHLIYHDNKTSWLPEFYFWLPCLNCLQSCRKRRTSLIAQIITMKCLNFVSLFYWKPFLSFLTFNNSNWKVQSFTWSFNSCQIFETRFTTCRGIYIQF